MLIACGGNSDDGAASATNNLVPSANFPVIQIDDRFKIDKVAEGLTYTTSMAWDNQGRLHVLEAGGGFMEEPPPARLLRVEANGKLTEVVNLTAAGIRASAVGLVFHQGSFYVSHRAQDGTGAVSRIAADALKASRCAS